MKSKFNVRNIRLFFIKLARSRNSINEIALGMSIGTFISVFPTFGFGTLLVLFFHRFIKFNLIAAFAASLISNPFTSPFFMLSSFKVGAWILDAHVSFSLEKWKENLKHTGLIILLGSIIVSGLMAVAVFFITKLIVARYRQRKQKKNESGHGFQS